MISQDLESRTSLGSADGMGLLGQHGGADTARVLGSGDLDSASAPSSTSCVTLTQFSHSVNEG